MDLNYIAFLERTYATKKGNQKWLAGKQLRKQIMKIKKQYIDLLKDNYAVRNEISQRSHVDLTTIDRWIESNVNNGKLTTYDILLTIAQAFDVKEIKEIITDEQPRKTETRI